MPVLRPVRSKVVPAGTAMLLSVMVVQLALLLMAVAASVNVQEARSVMIRPATTVDAKAPSRRGTEIMFKKEWTRYTRDIDKK